MQADPRRRVGDRLEQAIEHHVDVAGELERGGDELERRGGRLRRIVFGLAVAGVSLYLVAPSVVDVAGSWNDVGELAPGWLVAMVALQAAALACLWLLQRITLRFPRWRPVIASQLAGNAVGKVAPGGGAMGAALQYRMLVSAGMTQATTVSGLTAANLLTFGVLLLMPVLALPAVVRGGVDRELLGAALVSLGVLALLFSAGAVLLRSDRVLLWLGRVVQRVRNVVRRKSAPLERLPGRLVAERNRILGSVGPHWRSALLAAVGRWAFDLGCLVAALEALGTRPRLGLVVLAFCAAQLLAQIPVTPGGLGFVEAGLAGTLALAGVPGAAAALATFAYRLCSYWLQLPLGLVGVALHHGAIESSARATFKRPS